MNRSIHTFLLTIIVILATTIMGWSMPNKSVDTYLIGDGNGIFFSNDSEYFFTIEGMTPGDSESKVIKIKNNNSKPYKLYMRMKETKSEDPYDILSKLSLNINLDGKSIYTGWVSGKEKLIEIGEIKEKSSYKFEAIVALDGPSVGNEYANKEGIVEWEFIATNLEEGDTNNNPDNNEDGDINNNPDDKEEDDTNNDSDNKEEDDTNNNPDNNEDGDINNNPDNKEDDNTNNNPDNKEEDDTNNDSDNYEDSNTNVDSTTTTNPPKTGDDGILLYGILGTISFILLVIISRKRKQFK